MVSKKEKLSLAVGALRASSTLSGGAIGLICIELGSPSSSRIVTPMMNNPIIQSTGNSVNGNGDIPRSAYLVFIR